MQVKKQQLEMDMEQWTGSKLGKEYFKALYCHPVYLTYIEYIMRNARLDESQNVIKISGRNINNLRYTDESTLMAETKEELKSILMKVKEESEKAGLTFKKQRSWHLVLSLHGKLVRKKMQTVTDFIFLGSKITAYVDCSHEIKTLAPWKKSYAQPRQHIKKQRHYFDDKGPFSQSYGFSSSHIWM